MQRFLALFDAHVGYEPSPGKLKPLHDKACLAAVAEFSRDFRPHHLILGGDMLDCGPVSHHRKGKVGELEGLRLKSDAEELSSFITDLESTLTKPSGTGGGKLIYHVGNHERWLTDLTDDLPGLEGLLDVKNLLSLSKRWEIIPQGEVSSLGKLHFLHGDQISSTINPAKWAVEAYERNVRFGHFHTSASFTKIAALDAAPHDAKAIGCLCKRDPNYGGGHPNRWATGFLYGYVDEKSGEFTDFAVTIVNGKFMADGKIYRG